MKCVNRWIKGKAGAATLISNACGSRTPKAGVGIYVQAGQVSGKPRVKHKPQSLFSLLGPFSSVLFDALIKIYDLSAIPLHLR